VSESTGVLRTRAAALGLDLSDDACGRLEQYAGEVNRWATRLNLTRATPEEIASLHILDSLLPLVAWPVPLGVRLIDVGSGAGFPGIPIAIVRGDLAVTLVEASRRRVAFLEHVRSALALDTIDVVWARAGVLAHQRDFRGQFACAVERATAKVARAAELCLPFVAPGGAAVLIKGPAVTPDLSRIAPLIAALGGRLHSATLRALPGGRATIPVVIVKERATPRGFPRRDARLGRIPLAGPATGTARP
jgi:16S rRNA (guanine527-N7)-methyltransferase